MRDVVILADEESVISENWHCVDNDGNPVGPGEYTVIPKYLSYGVDGRFSTRNTRKIILR